MTPSPLPAAVGNAAGTANSAACDFVVTLGGLYCSTCKKSVLGRDTWFTGRRAFMAHLKENTGSSKIKKCPEAAGGIHNQLFSIHSRADDAMVMAEFPSHSTRRATGYYCRRCATTGRKDSVERHCKKGTDPNSQCCAIHVESGEIWTNHFGFSVPKPILNAIVKGKSPIFLLKNKKFPDRGGSAVPSIATVSTNGKNLIYLWKNISFAWGGAFCASRLAIERVKIVKVGQHSPVKLSRLAPSF